MIMSYYAGFFALTFLITLLVVGLIWLAIIRFTAGRWKPRSDKFDERQQIARGKAFRTGFWTLLVGIALWLVLDIAEFNLPVTTTAYFTTLLFIGAAAYAVECVFRDAYVALNDNPMRWILTDAFIVAINALCSYTNFRVNRNGWLNLGCALMLSSVLVALIVKTILNRQEEGGEEA